MSPPSLPNPAGYLRNLRLTLNGRPVTMVELREHFEAWASDCRCAPGLGYVCEVHRDDADD